VNECEDFKRKKLTKTNKLISPNIENMLTRKQEFISPIVFDMIDEKRSEKMGSKQSESLKIEHISFYKQIETLN